MFAELDADGAFEGGQGLAQLGLDLGDLDLDLEHLAPGGDQGRRSRRSLRGSRSAASSRACSLLGQDAVAEQGEDVLLGVGLVMRSLISR